MIKNGEQCLYFSQVFFLILPSVSSCTSSLLKERVEINLTAITLNCDHSLFTYYLHYYLSLHGTLSSSICFFYKPKCERNDHVNISMYGGLWEKQKTVCVLSLSFFFISGSVPYSCKWLMSVRRRIILRPCTQGSNPFPHFSQFLRLVTHLRECALLHFVSVGAAVWNQTDI